MRKTALVTGAAGQDGSYLCELLVSKGYQVDALVRPSGNRNYRIPLKCAIIWGDLLDRHDMFERLAKNRYDEVYHLGAVSHVATSFENPSLTFDTNLFATSKLLEALYEHSPMTKVYIASTSEMYGRQQENTQIFGINNIFDPVSPYGVSKVAAHHLAGVYRNLGMFIVRGIAFNHESVRRGENFVTRKIGLSLREKGKVTLGNLDAKRDWHHAKDTVRGMWLAISQTTQGRDYLFASGIARTVFDFVQEACFYFNLDPRKVVEVNKELERPIDIPYLCGDPQIAMTVLGWKPEISFRELVEDCCAPREKSPDYRL